MAAGYGLQRTEILEKAALAEFLDRTGRESQRTGLLHRLFQPVEHDDRETREAQFSREHETRGPAPATITSALKASIFPLRWRFLQYSEGSREAEWPPIQNSDKF